MKEKEKLVDNGVGDSPAGLYACMLVIGEPKHLCWGEGQ